MVISYYKSVYVFRQTSHNVPHVSTSCILRKEVTQTNRIESR